MSCFGNRQRRNFALWRLCLTILTIFSSSGYCRSTADSFGGDGFSSSSSSSSLPRKTLDQEIGSPSELAWQAWLLVENKSGGQSPLDSSNILRRITPKSIFIAPELIACPNGYSTDGKGVCKPDPIRIDEDAQRQFVLKRLNAMYGKFGNNRKKPSEAGGPLQINIPISLPSKANPPETQPDHVQREPQQSQQVAHKVEEGIAVGNPLAIPVVISQKLPPQLDSSNRTQEAVAVVVYKVDNITKKEQDQPVQGEGTTIFLGNSNSSEPKKTIAQVGQVLSVAKTVDDMNETISGIVNYKIPISLKPLLNRSDQQSDSRNQPEKKVDRPDSSEDSSPTVVLLLSPTQPTFLTSTQEKTETSKHDTFRESSVDHEPEQKDSTTVQTTNTSDDDVTSTELNATVQTVAPLDVQTVVDLIDSTLKNTEKTYTQDRLEDEIAYSESQTEQESDDQEYDDTTGDQYDNFGDSEHELLKPGEAGMMMSPKNQDLMKKNKQHSSTTLADSEDLTSTTFVDSTTMPTFTTVDAQNSFGASDSTIKTDATDYTKEDTMTTQTTDVPSTIITTEPSVEETTMFTVRPSRVKNLVKSRTRPSPSTQIPVTTSTESTYRTDSIESFESEKLVTEPEVIFSTQDSHSLTTTFGRKKPTHSAKVVEAPYTLKDLEDVIPRTEIPPLSDFHRRNPSDHRRQKPSITINDEPIIFKNDGNIPFEFRDQMAESSKPTTMDFRRIPSYGNSGESLSYIRFPEDSSETRSQGFVRFPSDDVNSIHNLDNYKEHLLLSPYGSRDEYNSNSPTSTKSSVPARQKPPSSHWRLPPPGLRMDRQQQQQQQQIQAGSSGNQREQKQKPMLMRFWARMPLVRDLSFYPTTSHGSHNEPIGGQDELQQQQQHRRLNSRFSTTATTMPARRVNYYKEMSTLHDIDRLLDQPAIGGG